MEKMKIIELKIPNLGEAESTEIIEINISNGSKISENDPLIVLESEKAAMEIPSDFSGEIQEVLVGVGDLVSEGQIFATIHAEKSDETSINKPEPSFTTELPESGNQGPQQKEVNLIGVNAGPAVRKYARELEIDLQKIKGTGRNGKITKEDLKKFIHAGKTGKDYITFNESDFTYITKYSIEKQSKIRAIAAENLHNSWITIPHVTHSDQAALIQVNKYRDENKVSVLAIFIKTVVEALQKFPIFNTSLLESNRIIFKEDINIGIAVNTDDGLIVPVIKDASEKSISEISSEISSLAEKARKKKLLVKDLSGATFTVSSLGKLGGSNFTPIINPPEVGIIGISKSFHSLRISKDGKLSEVEMLPFSLSYDHRVINGVDAGEFMSFIVSKLELFSK